ncbi:MAG: hypothetical protein K0U98_01970 [Deltaproteobacteria bacterium]|nr:hypothetical protein [Deltaproteobacteria bacterium]
MEEAVSHRGLLPSGPALFYGIEPLLFCVPQPWDRDEMGCTPFFLPDLPLGLLKVTSRRLSGGTVTPSKPAGLFCALAAGSGRLHQEPADLSYHFERVV